VRRKHTEGTRRDDGTRALVAALVVLVGCSGGVGSTPSAHGDYPSSDDAGVWTGATGGTGSASGTGVAGRGGGPSAETGSGGSHEVDAGGSAGSGGVGGIDASSSSSAAASATSAASSTSASGTGGGGAGPCVPSQPVDDDPNVPTVLSATGLYADIVTHSLASGVESFQPLYALWSDGAEKLRFIELPECTQIDTSNMDHWSFPVGTKLWKEFRVGGARIETRLVKRIGPGEGDYIFAAYQWNAAATEATHVPDGVIDANGTTHDIPATWECTTCHGHSPERVLGFGAVQLSHDGPGLTLAILSAQGRLTMPHPKFILPGNATTQAALGYLHANCGHCHNETPNGAWFNAPFVMRLSVDDLTPADTGVYQTAIGSPLETFSHPGITHRIAPGDPAASCVHYRMSVRGTTDQMPPFGTEQVDPAGMAAVDAWISGL